MQKKPSLIKNILLICYDYLIYKPFIKKVQIENSEKTILHIIQNRCSVSRFGDGELGQCWRVSNIPFQKYNEVLTNKMLNILMQNEPSDNHIICIPYAYNDTSHLTEEAKTFWKYISKRHKYAIIPYLPKTRYFDSLCTRCYIDYKDKKNCGYLFDLWKKIWDSRKVLIVEGEKTKLGIGNDLFSNATKLRRIIVPAEHCFDVYDDIINAVKLCYDNDDLILIAAGPTATVLAYDLSTEGYWAIDIGHIDIEYSWYKMKTTVKCPIPGKYVNEVSAYGDESIINDEYKQSIIYKVNKNGL